MNNYLMHYGVKGMKWGVRHDPQRSMRGNLHRALAGVYGVNERYYSKRSGKRNKTLASMNSAARKEQLKKAEKYDQQKKTSGNKKSNIKDLPKKARSNFAKGVGNTYKANEFIEKKKRICME